MADKVGVHFIYCVKLSLGVFVADMKVRDMSVEFRVPGHDVNVFVGVGFFSDEPDNRLRANHIPQTPERPDKELTLVFVFGVLFPKLNVPVDGLQNRPLSELEIKPGVMD